MNEYVPLLLFCFSTSITPGPNNIMIMLSGAKFGLIKSLPHYVGICIGFSIMVFLVGLGLGEVFHKVPILHQIIKYIGALYMLYLAYSLVTSTSELKVSKSDVSKPMTFTQGVLFQLVNPKAWVMAIGVIATYSLVGVTPLNQSMIIAMLYFVIGAPCVAIWFIFGIGISKYLGNQKHLKIFNYIMGFLLFCSIILMFFE